MKMTIALVETLEKEKFICLNESSFKTMKKSLCFTLKTLFVFKVFNFFPDFFDPVGKWTAWLESQG